MNSPEQPTLWEEKCAALLAVCDDLLAQGQEPVVPDNDSLAPEVKTRLVRGLSCLRRLEHLWPRRLPPTPTAQWGNPKAMPTSRIHNRKQNR